MLRNLRKLVLTIVLFMGVPAFAFAQGGVQPVNSELPAAAVISADNQAAPSAPAVYSFQMCFDGATWDRCTGTAADTELPLAAALTDAMSNPTAPAVAAHLMCYNGATWDRCLATPNIAHDSSAASANPMLIGGYANVAVPAAVSADLDAVRAWFTPNGVQVVQPVGGTTGGANECNVVSTASTNATNCKASAGTLYGYELINTTGTLAYVRLYNLSASPTCSSATGFIRSVPVPASTTGAGVERVMVVGAAYATGIGFCVTGGGTSTDNTNAPAGVYISMLYK